MKALNLVLVATLLFAGSLSAAESKQLSFKQEVIPGATVPQNGDKEYTEDYFVVQKVTVTEIETDPTIQQEMENELLNRNEKNLGQVIMTIDKLIALGKKLWAIIEAGRPVLTSNQMNAISVLPKTDDPDFTFSQMEGWSAPKAKTYRVEYTNLFGMKVIAFDYTTLFQYAGKYEGKGSYLTGVSVRASNISVAWGFSFDATSKLVNITNRGSKSNPLAGATLQIDYKASSVMRTISTSESFHVTGKGEVLKY